MFHWHQILKQMHKLTNREVEKRAIMELINFYEEEISAVIKQSEVELNKLNEIKQIQGLNTKVRIDRDCVRNAIKTIKSGSHSKSASNDAGGLIKKRKKEDNLQLEVT